MFRFTVLSTSTSALIRPVALLELGLFVTALLVVDAVWGTGNRFIDTSPHPFWFIILLLANQYGTHEGVIAALLCVLALYVNNMPPTSMTKDLFEYWYQVSRVPLMWLLTAVFFGEIRMRHKNRMAIAIDERETAMRDRDQIVTTYEKVKKQKERLDEQIAGQMRTVVSTYRAAKAIEQLDPNDVISGTAEMIKQVMNPASFSIFNLNNEGLVTAITVGWDEENGLDKQFASNRPLYQAMVVKQEILCVARKEDRDTLEDQGILAGPLVNPESGEVVGMIKIERLGFLDLNLSTIANFKAVCEWVGASYHNAISYQKAQSSSFYNHDSQLFSYGFLPKQIEFLRNLGTRVGFDVFLIIFRLEGAEDLPDAVRASIPRMVSRALGKVLRTSDLSFDYEKAGHEFAALLPNTPEKHVHIVQDKLRNFLEQELAVHSNQAKFSYAIQTVCKVEERSVQTH